MIPGGPMSIRTREQVEAKASHKGGQLTRNRNNADGSVAGEELGQPGPSRRTKAKAGSRNKGGDRDKAEGKGKEYGKGKGTGKIPHTPGSYVHHRMGSCLAPYGSNMFGWLADDARSTF